MLSVDFAVTCEIEYSLKKNERDSDFIKSLETLVQQCSDSLTTGSFGFSRLLRIIGAMVVQDAYD